MSESPVTANSIAWLIACALLLAAGLPIAAAEDSADDKWTFRGEAYLWAPAIKGHTSAADLIDIQFSDIFENLGIAAMGTLAARKDKVTLFTDLIYLDIEGDYKSTANIIHRPIETRVDAEMNAFIATLGGAYAFMETDNTVLDAFAGARYLWVKTDLDFDIGQKISESASLSGHVWDGIVGMRGQTRLNDKWSLTYFGDVGTGQSDLTWQALGAFSYKFEKFEGVLGYRYLRWNFEEGKALGEDYDNLYVTGPYAGVKFDF